MYKSEAFTLSNTFPRLTSPRLLSQSPYIRITIRMHTHLYLYREPTLICTYACVQNRRARVWRRYSRGRVASQMLEPLQQAQHVSANVPSGRREKTDRFDNSTHDSLRSVTMRGLVTLGETERALLRA